MIEIPENIRIGQPFTIEKGNRKARWKIIKHPYFDEGFALISDHIYLNFDNFMDGDFNHISHGSSSIENAYKAAYDCT